MIRISVIDDEIQEALDIRDMIQHVLTAQNESASIAVYDNAQTFLDAFSSGDNDIIFLDIQMPQLDGMTCAQRIRERDASVILIFVTSMVQYAVQGYRVEAMDYLVKPVIPSLLGHSLHRALKRLGRKKTITIRSNDGLRSLDVDELLYVEALNHRVILHTITGEIHCAQTLASIEAQLQGGGFFRCHAAFLVNMRKVQHIDGNDLHLSDSVIPISKHRRREFMQELAAYWGNRA